MSDIDPVEFGRLRADVDTLKHQMGEVRDDVRALLEMANKGKGGIWMFNAGLVALGGFGVWVLDHFLRR